MSNSIFNEANFAYMTELRKEVFSQEPFIEFLDLGLSNDERKIIQTSKNFLWVSDNYNWPAIKHICSEICSIFYPDPGDDIAALLILTWTMIPDYWKIAGKYHIAPANVQHPYIEFMHLILTDGRLSITKIKICNAMKFENELYSSLDTGIIVRRTVTNPEEHVFGHLVSKSKTKLRYAITVLKDSIWPNIDFDGIIQTIITNARTRYYDITNDAFVCPTFIDLENVLRNEKYRIVADVSDIKLFNFIVTLLDNPYSIEGQDIAPDSIASRVLRSRFVDDSNSSSSDAYDSSDSSSEDYNSSGSSDEECEARSYPRSIIEDEVPKQKSVQKPKYKAIPAKIRQMTWREYIGNNLDGQCWSCGDNISIEKWHAGHVIPASKGGPATVNNLRPLCQSCNLSMGNRHMAEFINSHALLGKGAKEFAEDVDDISAQMSHMAL